MRLINTHTFDFEEFYGDQIPRYAILSHTWQQGEEVTFQEWLRRDKDSLVQKKLGFDKIFQVCLLAQKDSLDWVWVDTNCIDKTSSAELTEAINSMYEWYSKSAICYAYLSDVLTIPRQEHDQEFIYELSKSRWWTRGWTLQELFAPTKVIFLTRAWKTINNRTSLAIPIEHISGISRDFLDGTTPLQIAYAGQKMSWLSKRETTRVEDMAYCMLGLFDINMPLLYGEGRKAFWRLQEEIIKVSNDHTIFCWTWTDTVPTTWVSMLAPWPDTFVDSWRFMSVSPPENGTTLMPLPYSMTNVGLSIQLPIIYTLDSWFVCLNVSHRRGTSGMYASVHVRGHGTGRGLRRCWFPASPILLVRAAAEKNNKSEERLYNFIIDSRSVGPDDHDKLGPGYSVLLFLCPGVTEYMCQERSTQLYQHVGVRAEPFGSMFDPETGLFGLARLSRDIYAGRLIIFPDSSRSPGTEGKRGISLFFAVTGVGTQTEAWHYNVDFHDDLQFVHPPELSIREYVTEEANVHVRNWIEKYKEGFFRPFMLNKLSYTKDRSMLLRIGGSLTVESGMVVQYAYLSSTNNSIIPFPSCYQPWNSP